MLKSGHKASSLSSSLRLTKLITRSKKQFVPSKNRPLSKHLAHYAKMADAGNTSWTSWSKGEKDGWMRRGVLRIHFVYLFIYATLRKDKLIDLTNKISEIIMLINIVFKIDLMFYIFFFKWGICRTWKHEGNVFIFYFF